MQSLTPIIAALIAAFFGSWVGAYLALSRFKKERAFDKKLDWYERVIRALHHMAQKIEIAATFEREGTAFNWSGVQRAHLVLDALTAEAELYGSSEAVKKTTKILARVQKVAEETEVFEQHDPGSMELIEGLPSQLRRAASPLAKEARRHLGLD